jgi:hypothetical protein
MALDSISAPLTMLAQAVYATRYLAGGVTGAPERCSAMCSAIRPAGDARQRITSAMPRAANCTI